MGTSAFGPHDALTDGPEQSWRLGIAGSGGKTNQKALFKTNYSAHTGLCLCSPELVQAGGKPVLRFGVQDANR